MLVHPTVSKLWAERNASSFKLGNCLDGCKWTTHPLIKKKGTLKKVIHVASSCGVWESLRLTCLCLLSLLVICKTFSRFSSLQGTLTAGMSTELSLLRSASSSRLISIGHGKKKRVFNEVRESHSKCWISPVVSFIQSSRKCYYAVP